MTVMLSTSVNLHFIIPSNFTPPPFYATFVVCKKVTPKSPRKLLGTGLYTKKLILPGTNLVFSAKARKDLELFFKILNDTPLTGRGL